MGRKLISLNFKPSEALPELDDLKAFLETEFARTLPGFTVLETNAKWGESALDMVGKDSNGGLVAVFPSVSRQERDYHDVLSIAMLASTWVEENPDEAAQRYRGVNLELPVRMLLVAPSLAGASRALTRALERAGLEMMNYSIFDIETAEGLLKAVSFGTPVASAAASAAAAAPRPASTPMVGASAPATAPVIPAPPPPAPEPQAEPRKQTAVEMFISSLPDPNIKAMSEQIMTFLLSRFSAAEGTVNGDKGFTLNVGREHLATIKLDKTALWLEVGPEKIPTNKIKDPATLERAMNLPSVLEALHSVNQK
jgi:hypothetical protein